MGFRKVAIFAVKRLLPLLVVLLLLACLAFFLFFDSIAQAGLKEAVKTVPGNLSVQRFSPTFSGIKLQKVKWFLDGKDPVFEASEMQIDLRFSELFSSDKSRLVEEVVIEKPRLRVVVDQNGNLNLLSLLPASDPEAAFELTELRSEVNIRDGWILYKDKRDAGFLYQLFDVNGLLALEDGKNLDYELSARPNRAADNLSTDPEQATEGQFALEGQISLAEPKFLGAATLEDIRLEPFAGYPGFGPGLTLIKGGVNGSVRATGEGETWNKALADMFLVGTLKLDEGVFRAPRMPAALNELGGEVKLLGSDVSLLNFSGRLADIGFEASGELELGTQGIVDGRVTTERFPLSNLDALLAQPFPVTGSAQADVSVSGTSYNVLVSGKLEGYDLTYEGQVVERASARFLRSGDLVHLPEVRGLTAAGEVMAEGWVFLEEDPRILLDVKGKGTDPSLVAPDIAQSADFEVRLLGLLQSPLAYGSGTLEGLGAWSQGLSRASGSFLYSGEDLLLYDGLASSGSSSVELSVGAYNLKNKTFSGILGVTDFLTQDVPGLTGIDGRFSGRAVVDADLSGEQPQVSAQAVMTDGDLTTGGYTVSDAKAEVLFDGSQLVIPNASGDIAGSRVNITGTFDTRNQGVQLVAQADNFDLGSAGRVDLLGTVQGSLNSKLGLYGVAESGQGKAAVSGYRDSNGVLSGVAWVDGRYEGVAVESTVVGQGTLDNLNLDYNARLTGGELAALGPVELSGSAGLQGRRLNVRPTVVTAPDAPSDSRFYPLTTYRGAAYAFFGPLMSAPLEKVVIEESPFPKARSFVVAGLTDLETGRLNMDFQLRAAGLEDTPMPSMVEKLPFQLLSGFGSFDGKLRGTLSNPRVEGDFLFPWLMLGDAEDRRLTLGTSGQLLLSDNTLKVKDGALSEASFDSRLTRDRTLSEGSNGLLNFDGYMKSDETFDIRVRTDGFSPHFFAFFAPQQFKRWLPSGSMATDSLHLWGSLSDPSISGQVELRDGGIMVAGSPYPIKSAFLDFSSQGDEILLSDLGLKAPGIDVTGNARRGSDGRLSGQIRARDIDLEKLHRFEGPWEGLDGEADFVVNLDGRFPGTPVAEMGFLAKDLVWNPKAIGGRDQSLAIERFVLGQFDAEERLVKGVTAAYGERGLFVEIPPSGLQFSRSPKGLTVTASGAISMPGGGPDFKTFSQMADFFASPSGPDFGRQGVPFQLDVENLATSELALLLGRDTQGAELSTSFAVALEGQWWRDHKVGAGDQLPHYNLTLEQFQLEGTKDGKSSGVRLDTVAEADYQREGKTGYLTLSDWQFGFFREQDLPEEAVEEGESVDPEDRILRRGVIDAGGKLAIASVPGATPSSEFNLGAADIPLANLGFLLPNGVPLSGLVESFELSLNGPLPSPNLSVSGLVSELALGPVQNMRLEGSVVASEEDGAYRIVVGEEEDESILLTFGDSDPEGHSVKIDGETSLLWQDDHSPNPDRLELFARNLGLSLDSPLNLSAEVVDNQLEALADLVPGEETAQGTFRGELVASGTLRRPEFEGRAVLEKGRFDSKRYGTFDGLELDARLTRITRKEAVDSAVLQDASSGFLTRLQVEKLEGKLGEQPFFGGGKAEFAGISPTFLNLFFVGESLPMRIPELFVGQVDIDMEVKGKPVESEGRTTLRPQLTGLLIMPEGEFKVPLGGGTSEEVLAAAGEVKSPTLPFDVEIDLSLGREFFVKALSSRIRAVGDLKLLAQNGPAEVFGQVQLSRGLINIPFYDASFRVRQGLAIFDGPFVPILREVEAVADLGGYRITARANGRYPDTFKLDLYSDPPLPQAELNRVAVLGGLPSTFSGSSDPTQNSSGTLGNLSNQGVSFLSGILTNRLTEQIGKIFFLSELSFDYIPPATYAIKLAKALDENDSFLITVTRIIRDSGLNENLFGIEWRFTRSLLVRAAFDQLSRARFWFQSINRF